MIVSAAALTRELMAAGLQGESLCAALERLEVTGATPPPAPITYELPLGGDAQAQRRRAADRERKRKKAVLRNSAETSAEKLRNSEESSHDSLPLSPLSCSGSEQLEGERASKRESGIPRNSVEAEEPDADGAISSNLRSPSARSISYFSRHHLLSSPLLAKLAFDPTWSPTEADHLAAEAIGLTDIEIDREAGAFHDHCLAKGVVSADWSAAWRTWCRRAVAWPGRKLAGITRLANAGAIAPPYSAQWRAWLEHKRARGESTVFMEDQAKSGIGWSVPSEWPPGHS
jgi:hypothetical protein